MLSDRDQETLHEIQCQLEAEDPRFARAFDTDTTRQPTITPGRTRRIYTVLLMLTCLTLTVSVLTAGSMMSALELAAVAAMTFEARRRHDIANHQRER